MRDLRLNHNGFATLLVIIVAIVIVVIGGISWYAWSSRQGPDNKELSFSDPEGQKDPQPEVVKTGVFKNVGSKKGSGAVSLLKSEDNSYTIRLESDFVVQKGPALYVAFGDGDEYAEGTAFAPLKELSGKQEYKVPANLNANNYKSIIVWCEEFSVAFTSASLK